MKTIHVVVICATILVGAFIFRPPNAPTSPSGGAAVSASVVQQQSAAEIEQQRAAAIERERAIAIERERAAANERERLEKERAAAIQREQARMRSAMESVLAKDTELSKRIKSHISSGSKPADAIATYASALKSLDMSQCPTEFREAYLRHANAWRDFALQVGKEPQGFADGVLQGFLNSLSGEFDGGAGRLQKARDNRMEAVSSTWGEVEAIAVRHGARLSAQ